MKVKTGVDIIYIPDFAKKLKNPDFVKKTFLDSELKTRDYASLAGIFALKEAFFKAVSPKIKRWTDIEVKHVKGKPKIDYDCISIDGSISHNGDYAIGFVVIIE